MKSFFEHVVKIQNNYILNTNNISIQNIYMQYNITCIDRLLIVHFIAKSTSAKKLDPQLEFYLVWAYTSSIVTVS